MLRLAGVVLVKGVRHVEGRSRRLHVQVERARVAGMSVQPIEERQTVAIIVECSNLPVSEDPISAHPTKYSISELR